MLFGTEVHTVPSGLIWNVTVVERVPEVDQVTRQLTQGRVWLELFWAAWFESPVN